MTITFRHEIFITFASGLKVELGLPGLSAVLTGIDEKLTTIMSKISEYTDAVNAKFDAMGESVDALTTALEGVSSDVAQLKATIEEQNNNPGPISPEDQALLDSSQEQAGALVNKLKAVADALKALDDATAAPPAPEPPSDGTTGTANMAGPA